MNKFNKCLNTFYSFDSYNESAKRKNGNFDGDFIEFDKNSEFSSLTGRKVDDLLQFLSGFDLEYLDRLSNIPFDSSFGCELEFEGLPYYEIFEYMRKRPEELKLHLWRCAIDLSLVSGGELKSPILFNGKKDWNKIKEACETLRVNNADTDDNASCHVHVGSHVLGPIYDSWRVYMKLICLYEKVLFRFFMGDRSSMRKNVLKYAKPISEFIYDNLDIINNVSSVSELFNEFICNKLYDKRQFISFKYVNYNDVMYAKDQNTIEYRGGNGTDNEIIVQNYINCCLKIMLACSDLLIDEEFLNYKLKNFNSCFDLSDYSKVHLGDSLEFVDLVYPNNLEKLYFMKQYVKKFDNNKLL